MKAYVLNEPIEPASGPAPDDETARRKHAVRVHNERMKAIADMGKVAFGGIVVGGIVKFVFDPSAPSIGFLQLALTFVAAGLAGGLVWIALGWQRPEE